MERSFQHRYNKYPPLLQASSFSCFINYFITLLKPEIVIVDLKIIVDNAAEKHTENNF